MRVLVTRPQPDALETANMLIARGHQPIVAPLVRVNYHDGPEIDLSGVQAILATSANGVRALSRRLARRDLPVFAVGPKTAHTATDVGFSPVKSADGDAEALAKAVATWTSPQQGQLVHASGTETEGKLAATLTSSGFQVRTEFLYDVSAVVELPVIARDALSRGEVDGVLLFSPRSARIFAQLVSHAGLNDAASSLIGICISRAAALNIAPLNMHDVRVAKRPNQRSLLDCLD
jgi:uroporphyrinogen-III synthase